MNNIQAATKLYQERFLDADCFFLCGSTVRGEATKSSDLDIVIIYKNLPQARRESFYYQGWPVEIFVHDLETLNYFFQKVDGPGNIPSLAQMLNEGKLISKDGEVAQKTKQMAKAVIEDGPTKLEDSELNNWRYSITDLLDDIRAPRNPEELIASGVNLFDAMATLIFRTQNSFGAKGKWIPRRLDMIDSKLKESFYKSFQTLFTNHNPSEVIVFCEQYLNEHGGLLFEGHNLDAPKKWRLPLK